MGRNFNCTIQELKQIFLLESLAKREFQLHHTGIKTIELKSMSKEANISIAPYRN